MNTPNNPKTSQETNQNDSEQIKALNTLIVGIRLAQSRGAFTLSESAMLFENMKVFMVDSSNEPNGLVQRKEDDVKTL